MKEFVSLTIDPNKLIQVKDLSIFLLLISNGGWVWVSPGMASPQPSLLLPWWWSTTNRGRLPPVSSAWNSSSTNRWCNGKQFCQKVGVPKMLDKMLTHLWHYTWHIVKLSPLFVILNSYMETRYVLGSFTPNEAKFITVLLGVLCTTHHCWERNTGQQSFIKMLKPSQLNKRLYFLIFKSLNGNSKRPNLFHCMH